MCREWPASCQPWHSGYAQETIKMTGVPFPTWRCSSYRKQEKRKRHMIPSLRDEHTGVEKTFGSKISIVLKMGSLQKFFKFKSLKQKQTSRGDSHTGLEELTPVMRLTISPTSRTVRTSVPDDPELIVQEQGSSMPRAPSMAPPG